MCRMCAVCMVTKALSAKWLLNALLYTCKNNGYMLHECQKQECALCQTQAHFKAAT